jgi:predicted ribosome quality control (RQC) complex YloA/Tae2 family protein
VGEKVESFVRLQELGRILSIKFSGEGEPKEVRLILIPGRVNIELHVGPKSVYALKPKEIPEKQENGQARLGHENEFFAKRWAQQNQTQGKPQEKSLEKDKAKKQKGLAKMLETLQKQKEDLWQKAGDWLKQNQSFESLPTELEQKVDLSQTLAWNIQNCFSQSKKNQAKIKGTEERILKLKNELASLENGETTERRIEKKPTSLLHQAKLKGKTKTLREGRLFIGKSGPENLKLLRKAKPWYYWIHIKDYPGSYGIIERNKNQKISPESLEQASLAVVRQSLPRGAEGLFQVLYAECRYVRPIKGAKSGQVTYSHEKVLTIKVTP